MGFRGLKARKRRKPLVLLCQTTNQTPEGQSAEKFGLFFVRSRLDSVHFKSSDGTFGVQTGYETGNAQPNQTAAASAARSLQLVRFLFYFILADRFFTARASSLSQFMFPLWFYFFSSFTFTVSSLPVRLSPSERPEILKGQSVTNLHQEYYRKMSKNLIF